ncbi:MAG TPA: glucuronate isomerase [Lachnospiraceae bacterium]|nr:glucuronate isomerase [Lachnospiraceae bacterium]
MGFIDENFMLYNETAKKLFNEYAKNEPIYDFHCHLSPKEIYENKNFEDISDVWLGGDHYKWRAMRSLGIPEEEITGKNADKLNKFVKWAETIQYAIGNPLYHWTHLELQRYFGIYEPLTKDNAVEIHDKINAMLSKPEFKVRELIKRSNVAAINTTDDPADSLEYHKLIAEDEKDFKVYPAWRPDKALNIDSPAYADYIKTLGDTENTQIKTFADLKQVLLKRMDLFDSLGCRASDHAFTYVPCRVAKESEVDAAIALALSGQKPTVEQVEAYKTALMLFLGTEYTKRDWAMELHINIKRDNNKKMFEKMGPDTGFDCIGDWSTAEGLTNLLDLLNYNDALPKTIIFAGNPADNQVFGTILGCFQGTEAQSKIQFGTAWWFNDNRDGMEAQIKTLGNLGVLGKFIGMLTDSRSFLSYPRHEYFRRILCNIFGEWVEKGEYAGDIEFVGKLVSDICYGNAARYFNLEK